MKNNKNSIEQKVQYTQMKKPALFSLLALHFKEEVNIGHFPRQDLAKKNFFSNFFFLKMGSGGSILEARELSFFNFYQIFRVRAGQSWSTGDTRFSVFFLLSQFLL